MIKYIKLFVNNNDNSMRLARIVREHFTKNGFVIVDDDSIDNYFDLGIAIGGDGAFIRMIRGNNFNTEPYYIGINAGTLGFLQEANEHELGRLIGALKDNNYKTENMSIQETRIIGEDKEESLNSINEIIVRDKNLVTTKLDIYVDDNLLERFAGDAIMVSTTTGSTGHNLSYGGSIVYSNLEILQINHIASINSKAYTNLVTSVILPGESEIEMIPDRYNRSLMITRDGEHHTFDDVDKVITSLKKEKIKCLRFKDSNFSRRVNEKLLSK